jgi:arylsulfatase A-like enzyme
MTGLHGGHARIRGNKKVPLAPDDLTVATLLKRAGYQTAAFGKWGLGEIGTTGSPLKQGFDTFFGYTDQTHAHNYYPTFLWKNDQKFPLPNTVPPNPAWRFNQGVATDKKVWSHDAITTEALTWLRTHASTTDNEPRTKDNSPFFLCLPFPRPHANNESQANGMEVPSDAPYSDKPWPQPEKNKAAMIARLDQTVGQITALLKELHQEDNTLILFTSDNGPHNEGGVHADFFHASGPFRGVKRDLYEGGIRVPLIARWPTHIAPNSTTDFVTASWDFLPTAADLAGIDLHNSSLITPHPSLRAGLDGHSILPTLLGRAQEPHPYLYFEFHERGFEQALRIRDYKIVRHGTRKPVEIYHLPSDPGEAKDLAKTDPVLTRQALDLFTSARTDSTDFPIDESPRKKPQKPADE